VCYVNNIIGTLQSDRHHAAAIFVARAVEHMSQFPPTDNMRPYYDLVSRYLASVTEYLRSKGCDPENLF